MHLCMRCGFVYLCMCVACVFSDCANVRRRCCCRLTVHVCMRAKEKSKPLMNCTAATVCLSLLSGFGFVVFAEARSCEKVLQGGPHRLCDKLVCVSILACTCAQYLRMDICMSNDANETTTVAHTQRQALWGREQRQTMLPPA